MEHTTHRGHASELGARAVAESRCRLVHGGDGTVNETVNGMLGAPAEFAARSRPQLGVIPAVAAPTFARTGVDADPPSPRASTSTLETGQYHPIGLAHTADRWFLFKPAWVWTLSSSAPTERNGIAGKAATPLAS